VGGSINGVPGEILGELLPLVREISSVLDPDELFPVISTQLRRLVDYESLALFRQGGDNSLVAVHQTGPASPEAAATAAEAAQRRETVSSEAAAAVPLFLRGNLVAILHLRARAPLEPRQLTALGVFAEHLAVAIENARLHRETRWYAGLLAMLYDIGKETASILELDRLLQRVAEVVKRVIDYETFGIFLLDETSQELVLRKAVRYGSGQETRRLRANEGLCGAAVRSKEPIRVADVRADARYVDLVPETRSELVVPLLHKDRVLGVFDLQSTSLARFTDEHVKVLMPLASQVAVAIENARLYAQIVRRDAALRRELTMAREIQHGLFPERAPTGAGFEAAAQFRPARELGGDLHDFYELGEGLLGLSVGDVSGKGVAAALFGAFTSGTVRARAFERHPPANLLERVNRTLVRRGTEGLFCTLSFSLFDFAGRRLRIASSGLPYPLRFEASTGRCTPLEIPGVPLGLFANSTYEEREVSLAAGDVWVFYSDGVTEGTRGEEEYGMERLKQQVCAHAGQSAAEIASTVLADVEAFRGPEPREDDTTLVVVKVL
jgi:sigma-B regulation protein RsbU (phosphoserine phosphatase)